MISIFSDFLQQISHQRLLIRQFDAMNPADVMEAVHHSVTASVIGLAFTKKRDYMIDSSVSDWKTLPMKHGLRTARFQVRMFSDLEKTFSRVKPCISIDLKWATHPFAEGTEFLVYHGYIISSSQRVVVKKYKFQGEEYNNISCYLIKKKVCTLCSVYANKFTRKIALIKLQINPMNVMVCGSQYYLVEIFLEGEMEKYNNNVGVVCSESPLSQLLQAFSHFS